MATPKKAIATPKKGKASDSRVKRSPQTGAFKDVKSHHPLKTNKDSSFYLTAKVTGVKTDSSNRAQMISRVREGLNFIAITQLEVALHASQREMAQLLSIPLSTLRRRKKDGHLHPDESDRVVRFARLKDAAVELMRGDDDAAVNWLRTPLEVLGCESPLAHATTELGARDVEDLIIRLRHGVFS